MLLHLKSDISFDEKRPFVLRTLQSEGARYFFEKNRSEHPNHLERVVVLRADAEHTRKNAGAHKAVFFIQRDGRNVVRTHMKRHHLRVCGVFGKVDQLRQQPRADA